MKLLFISTALAIALAASTAAADPPPPQPTPQPLISPSTVEGVGIGFTLLGALSPIAAYVAYSIKPKCNYPSFERSNYCDDLQFEQTFNGVATGIAVAALGFGLGIPLWVKGARGARPSSYAPATVTFAVAPQSAGVRWTF